MIGIEVVCPNCGIHFFYCRSCWRGNKYCGSTCRVEARQIKQRNYEKKYTLSLGGKESRRKRQKDFRGRNKKSIEVTDQSIGKNLPHVNQQFKINLYRAICCLHCERSIEEVIKEGGEHELSNQHIPKENNYFSFTRFKSKNY